MKVVTAGVVTDDALAAVDGRTASPRIAVFTRAERDCLADLRCPLSSMRRWLFLARGLAPGLCESAVISPADGRADRSPSHS